MLERLAKKHNLWLKMLNNLDCDNSIAEDIVQEMYIRLHEHVDKLEDILINDDINTYFVYITLRNMYISHIRSKKMTMYPIISDYNLADESLGIDYYEMESSYFYYLKDKLKDALMTFNAQERQIYELHYIKGQSQRKISRESEVSLNKIQTINKNIKRKLRIALLEDVQDYYNEDFNFKM